jgi:hypothetical protein
VAITDQARPPLRFIAGADSIATAEQKVAALQQHIHAFRDLSTSQWPASAATRTPFVATDRRG